MGPKQAPTQAQEPPWMERLDREEPPKLNGLKKTADFFGFKDIPELFAFWESKLWKPYATHIMKYVIQPQRDAAALTGRARARLANFATVEGFLEEGEKAGRALYSDDQAEFSEFEAIDHYCYALYHLRYNNSRKFKGLFFGKPPSVRPHLKLCLIWAMLQVWFYEHTPSRIERRKLADAKRALAAEKEKARKKARTEVSDETTTTEPAATTTEPEDDESEDVLGENAPEYQDKLDAETAFPTETHAPLDEGARMRLEIRVRHQDDPSLLTEIMRPDQTNMISPIEKMNLERATGDIYDRAYKYDLLLAVRAGFQDPRHIEDQLYQLASKDRVTDDEAWQRSLAQASNDTDAALRDYHTLPFDLATNVDKEIYVSNQSLLDNYTAQPQDHARACARMGIARPEFPRYESMPLSKSFKHWQVLAFDWIHEMRKKHLNGVLLCDSMGLGKTWEIVGYMLSSLHLRRQIIAANETVEPARPFLVVVPLECCPISGLYWGDYNDTINSSRKKAMTIEDELFNGAEKNASTVIITTYQTWRSRHGPSAQEAWHIKTKKWTQEKATREFHLADKAWPGYLRDCISVVICDEAQYIKSIKAQSHTAIVWVNTFTILVTATPDINSVSDFEAYINLIAPNESTIQRQVWDEYDFQPALNPYDLVQTSEPGRLLRCTRNNFKRFILDSRDPIEQGARLSLVYGDCMIRRSNVSIVDGKMIGNDIPALKHRRAECDWLVDDNSDVNERKEYVAHSKQHVRALIRVDEHGNVTWNWKHYRALLLLSTWTGFAHIEELMLADSTADLIQKDDVLGWIVGKYCTAVGEAFPDDLPSQLSVLCRGAPKIRALLQIIAEVAVLKEKKLFIFCSVPAQQVLLYAIFSALKISVGCYYADLEGKEKVKLQSDFNTLEDPQVLIGSFATTSVGMNLQAQCHWVIFLDPPPSIAIGEQAGGRCHRVGQSDIVELVTLITTKSFNDRQVRNNLKKAVPGVVAALNKEAFKGAELRYNEDGEARLLLGDWVNYNGRLIKADDPKLPQNHGLAILKGTRVVTEVIEMRMGMRIGWDDDEDGEGEGA